MAVDRLLPRLLRGHFDHGQDGRRQEGGHGVEGDPGLKKISHELARELESYC